MTIGAASVHAQCASSSSVVLSLSHGWAVHESTSSSVTLVYSDICGDGVRGRYEECDDSNTDPHDGCSPSCFFEPGDWSFTAQFVFPSMSTSSWSSSDTALLESDLLGCFGNDTTLSDLSFQDASPNLEIAIEVTFPSYDEASTAASYFSGDKVSLSDCFIFDIYYFEIIEVPLDTSFGEVSYTATTPTFGAYHHISIETLHLSLTGVISNILLQYMTYAALMNAGSMAIYRLLAHLPALVILANARRGSLPSMEEYVVGRHAATRFAPAWKLATMVYLYCFEI